MGTHFYTATLAAAIAYFCGSMTIHSIRLLQFKNHASGEYRFPARITGICGPNGSGKTNLLDALYFLSFTRSYFSKTDGASVQHGCQGFRIEAEYGMAEDAGKVSVVLRETGKKEVAVDADVYTRVSEHIGRFPAIMIAPDDVELITGGSEERRKFTDSLLSQLNPEYLQQLMLYNKLVQQRNSHLKQMGEQKMPDNGLLEVYDHQLAAPANHLFEKRRSFFEDFAPRVNRLYNEISGHKETIGIAYTSPLQQDSMETILRKNLQRDMLLQRTSSGIHRDELVFTLGEQSFKQVASQGQRKSLLFALKLAACEVLREQKGFPPLLLLDDVFEKLDQQRMQNLLKKVCVLQDGQVFITDTHRERLENTLSVLDVHYAIIQL